jgi:hypothetical protein
MLRTASILFLLAAPAAALEGWHRTREEGTAAAKKSGKPVLVVTLWAPGV